MNSANASKRAMILRTAATALASLLCGVLSVRAQDQDKQWKLEKVSFVGLQTQKPEEMTAASGLQLGQTIDVAGIKAASQKLSDSGLFKRVAARYQYQGENVEVIFTVEELPAQKATCIFDNFVWLADQEITQAIKRELPDFDGTAASNDYTVGLIKKVLVGLLQERKVTGEVAYERNEDPEGGRSFHIFTVKAPNLRVCAVQLVGLKADLKRELERAWQSHLNTDYSRTDSNSFMRAALLPIYQNSGYLKVRFAPVQAHPASGGECKGAGVVVTLSVEEGLQYRWQGAVWSGNQAFNTKELESGFKLKPGDIANLDSIEDSFGWAQAQYSKRGYLTARVSLQPVFDDTQRTVSYQATVTEGPQYRMGQLLLTGLTESETKQWQGRLKLKAGDIFNAMTLSEFTQELRQDHAIKDFDLKYKLDHTQLTADVVIEIKK